MKKLIDLLVHSPMEDSTITSHLGRPDYSYYFVMKRFLPLLESLGCVKPVPHLDLLDAKCRESRAIGRIPILVCFAPPHSLPIAPPCVVIPVFAWEFDTIPDEQWDDDPRQNWKEMLRDKPVAITHSEYTVDVVRQALGADYPIVSIPAPVWDIFSAIPRPLWDGSSRTICFEGLVVDSRSLSNAAASDPELLDSNGHVKIDLSGPVFTSVLSPSDYRKNLHDIVTAFVWAFRDNVNATLVLKLIHFDAVVALRPVLRLVKQVLPYRCRIVAICAYLDDDAYHNLVRGTAFVVNASSGEGQCLPLMEFMSAGKPALAPNHTAMADYIDAENSFIVSSSREWGSWPQDPRGRLRCMRYRIDWDSLRLAYLRAWEIATSDLKRYREMSRHAVEQLGRHNSSEVAKIRLAAVMKKAEAYAIGQELARKASVHHGRLNKAAAWP